MENSKFNDVLAILSSHVVDEVQNALNSKPYERIKAAVISCIGIIAETELADRKSSQLLRHMWTLTGNPKIDDTLLRDVALEAAIWHAGPLSTLERLYAITESADNIWDTHEPNHPRGNRCCHFHINSDNLRVGLEGGGTKDSLGPATNTLII